MAQKKRQGYIITVLRDISVAKFSQKNAMIAKTAEIKPQETLTFVSVLLIHAFV